MLHSVPGTGFVEARAAGGFMPGFGSQGGGVQVTPRRDESVAATPKTPATAGSPPVTPASQIIPSFSTMSLDDAETKEDEKKTLNYLRHAPTIRLDDTHVDTTQENNDPEAATQKDTADVQSIKSTPYQPDNQLGLSDAESPWPKDSETPEPLPEETKNIPVPPSLSMEATRSVAASPAACPKSSAAEPLPDKAKNASAAPPSSLEATPNVAGSPAACPSSSAADASQQGGVGQQPSQGSGGGSAKKSKYSDGTYWKFLESIRKHYSLFMLYLVVTCSLDAHWDPKQQHTLRLRNYVRPNSRGEVKASENVLKLYKTEKGRFLATLCIYLLASSRSTCIYCTHTYTHVHI